jgi:hypothetical protein
MISRLDDISRKTIGRFGLKLCFGILFATIGRQSFLLTLSMWLSLYALLTALIGVVAREPISKHSFNHWDEAMWLTASAVILKAVG